MEELRRDEAIREAARKSGVMETPKKSNRKGGFSIKARLQKVRSNVRSISATELRRFACRRIACVRTLTCCSSDRRGSGRDKDSSSRESNSKESNSKESVSESAPVAAAEEANAVAADGEELSIFDFLRTVNPEDVPVPRSKRVVDGGSSPRLGNGYHESRVGDADVRACSHQMGRQNRVALRVVRDWPTRPSRVRVPLLFCSRTPTDSHSCRCYCGLEEARHECQRRRGGGARWGRQSEQHVALAMRVV